MKKGFTLVEVLAVIVILGLLALIAIPSYIKASSSVKESNLNNIKTMVTTTMLNYANLNYIDQIKESNNTCSNNDCCKYYSIEYMKNNNIFQANNGQLINPVTGAELTGYVKISFDTTKLELVSEFKDNANDIGNCEKVEYEENNTNEGD